MTRILIISLAILAISLASPLPHTTKAETLVVGNRLGWLVPPGGDLAYATWAAINTFTVGDVLLFNFTTGQDDVARVTRDAFLTCNSTNPISLQTTGPANFTLNSTGEYYFIGTISGHCPLGQRLAIYVTSPGSPNPAPHPPYPYWAPAPVSPRAPRDYTVGEGLGWRVLRGGPLFYVAWAHTKTFMVEDTLVFNFTNGQEDVALVTENAFKTCNISSTIQVWSTSPARILLNASGDYYFTSTYPNHCILGQQLAIRVVGSNAGPAQQPSSSTTSTSVILPEGSTASIPLSPPPVIAGLFFAALLSIAIAFS